MSEAVRKIEEYIIEEYIRNERGARFSPKDLPFEMIFEDLSYDSVKWGTLCEFVFQVPVVEGSQTPQNAYVAVYAILTRDKGFEDPSGWTIHEVEKETRTITVWKRKK